MHRGGVRSQNLGGGGGFNTKLIFEMAVERLARRGNNHQIPNHFELSSFRFQLKKSLSFCCCQGHVTFWANFLTTQIMNQFYKRGTNLVTVLGAIRDAGSRDQEGHGPPQILQTQKREQKQKQTIYYQQCTGPPDQWKWMFIASSHHHQKSLSKYIAMYFDILQSFHELFQKMAPKKTAQLFQWETEAPQSKWMFVASSR